MTCCCCSSSSAVCWLLTRCRLENESKPRVERGKTVVDSTDDLSTEKERTLGFLKRVVGGDGSVKLDKDKVVRKLKGNADASRHKAKLGGIAKKMAEGAMCLRPLHVALCVRLPLDHTQTSHQIV